MHIAKKGLRVLGIAESFSGRERSTLCGVVMRKDLLIDGAAFADVTVGGTDATDAVIQIQHELGRKDINCLMLSGCVISWFNILDPQKISCSGGLPVIAVTYEDSPGLIDDIRHHFPGDTERISAYRNLGARSSIDLNTGYRVFIRAWGISEKDAALVCDAFTFGGKVPEPLRVARLMARAAMRWDKG
jgi:endonuclease V-like protein UPF0215 family